MHFIEGFMPIQFLLELLGGVLLLAWALRLFEWVGFHIGRFMKGLLVVSCGFMYLKYWVYPPMPSSILVPYMAIVLIANLLWASSSDAYWQEFKQPVVAVLDGDTSAMRLARSILVILLPLMAGWTTWDIMQVKIAEPIELRTVGPAPPATFQLHGKEIVLQTAKNPYRVNRQGTFDPHYMAHKVYDEKSGRSWEVGLESDAWNAGPDRFLLAAKEGGGIYFQECVFCHGANLNGRGIFSHAFSNPFPVNFTDPGTIAQLQESYAFWRTATGGISIPREGFPWASTMPGMEEHLSIDDIWKVVLFTYWHTGWVPRTWD
jgi:hypothetical protein